jgi:hypothetical protein
MSLDHQMGLAILRKSEFKDKASVNGKISSVLIIFECAVFYNRISAVKMIDSHQQIQFRYLQNATSLYHKFWKSELLVFCNAETFGQFYTAATATISISFEVSFNIKSLTIHQWHNYQR